MMMKMMMIFSFFFFSQGLHEASHHIIINSDFITDGDIVPANAQHIHFGLGQIVTTLDLDEGNYSLTLQFADGMHQSYGKDMSKTINVTVRI